MPGMDRVVRTEEKTSFHVCGFQYIFVISTNVAEVVILKKKIASALCAFFIARFAMTDLFILLVYQRILIL